MSPIALDALGLAASDAFAFGFIGAATLLMRRRVLRGSAARKVIHIGVAHWWLIAMGHDGRSLAPSTFLSHSVELFTPLDIDNLTVPLVVATLYAGVFA